ncbi:hypothetical protein NAT51_10265 [Flavobacterium amniphilum]|uniref:hypothetical protein n=1 Tax=Flavobacterium amniphilum TaxID=1834035 RepID=UPI00202A457E|nr:hypothetical protein [Flavobacterium amniphilum]MCL9805908.1 hypothetical protein [Flavobacterium amniphilum]
MLKLKRCLILISMFLLFLNCGGVKRESYQELKIGNPEKKTGYVLYDGKEGHAYFIEKKHIDLKRLSKHGIAVLKNKPDYVIILRTGLSKFRESEYLSLTLCNKDERLIIKKSDFLYERYCFVRLEDYNFYVVLREYKDSIQRLIFCQE